MKIAIKTKRARIELIPLLDMIFLVLVSFVYIFLTMTVQKGIPVRLPHAESAMQDKKEYVVVTLTDKNEIYLNKRQTSLKKLTADLSGQKSSNADIRVFVNADKRVIYDMVIQVIDAVRKAGIEKVSLETTAAKD